MDYKPYLTICRSWIDIYKSKNPSIPLTSELIRESVYKALGALYKEDISTLPVDDLVNEMEEIYSTWVDQPLTLSDGKHIPWLQNKLTSIKWQYWERYRHFLYVQGWADETITRLDEATREILGFMEDPERVGKWDVRGLVVGQVQSGKTANYIGTICRAMDAGYKVIVVLTGSLENLRIQTQIRFDEGLLGFDSTYNLDFTKRQPIGVGGISKCKHPIDTITTRVEKGDFSMRVAKQFGINPGGNPLLFIIKKNGRILLNLIKWVEWASRIHGTVEGKPMIRDIPLLVIDDEADYGSINTKKPLRDSNDKIDEAHDPTVINKRIRQLLFYFEKSAYLGYTATPFANIFIHPQNYLPEYGEDLFPKNFITSLPTPSNHVGPSQVFGIPDDPDSDLDEVKEIPVIREVDDWLDWLPPGHKNHFVPLYHDDETIPPSLRKAILSFVLACAIRRSRGQKNVHNSMLIHVTRFVSVQKAVINQVSEFLTNVQQRLQYGDGDRSENLLQVMKGLWETDFLPTASAILGNEYKLLKWKTIEQQIFPAAMAIMPVKEINGTSGDILDYVEHKDCGLNVIVVGGDKLSRGLTLEGLTVSYFLRNSHMYDTLMQMGRWFGYRPGYLDVCRLYLPDDLKKWFRHITLASEELRQEFAQMAAMRRHPDDYGLRVRSHPDLLVTAPVKMREGTRLEISFAGSICETVVFNKDSDIILQNFHATRDLLERLTHSKNPERNYSRKFSDGKRLNWNGLYWENVPYEEICQFLREYKTHRDARKVNTKLLVQYIESLTSCGENELTQWSVFLVSSSSGRNLSNLEPQLNTGTKTIKRDWLEGFRPTETNPQKDYHIRRLLSPSDEGIDISEESWKKAMEYTIIKWRAKSSANTSKEEPKSPGGWALRQVRNKEKGLLMIYPLDPSPDKSDLGPEGPPIIGIGISFPTNLRDRKVSYIVNRVYTDQEYEEME